MVAVVAVVATAGSPHAPFAGRRAATRAGLPAHPAARWPPVFGVSPEGREVVPHEQVNTLAAVRGAMQTAHRSAPTARLADRTRSGSAGMVTKRTRDTSRWAAAAVASGGGTTSTRAPRNGPLIITASRRREPSETITGDCGLRHGSPRTAGDGRTRRLAGDDGRGRLGAARGRPRGAGGGAGDDDGGRRQCERGRRGWWW